jgi:hypothetical protein
MRTGLLHEISPQADTIARPRPSAVWQWPAALDEQYAAVVNIRALPLRIGIFARIDLPEQRLELLGELVNIALPFLTTPPPLQHAIA